jgi:TolB-like protein
MSGDPGFGYFGQGVAEDVVTILSTYPGIRVVSRSCLNFDKPTAVQDIGKAHEADYIVERSVRKAGDQGRVAAQLI